MGKCSFSSTDMLQTLRIGVAMKELLLFNRFGSQMEIAGKTKQLNINIQQPLNHLRMYNSPPNTVS